MAMKDEQDDISITMPLVKAEDHRMVISDTLVILYLGFIQIHYPILLADIRHWVREGWLPYLTMPESTPSHILMHIKSTKRHALYGRVRKYSI
jgi:hypothetical protein